MGHPIFWLCVFLLVGWLPAFAGGARYVTGPPFFTGAAGVPVGWRGPGLLYYTDPGDLSAYVNHAAADALVASAAGVWNVPVAAITVGRGGALAEHVSGANVYLGSGGMVYPDDVSSANYAARPIAVIYDTDGSVTDTLLGAGASAPSGCRQNAVTESVDRFDPAGYILHAILILNGRCTAADPAAQSEMQYKLQRAFGRVLGLAWSQANDNVFTGVPVPTYQQALHWPVMHPVEIICGPYSFQCMPSPFTLRPDDISSMVLVYPITTAAGAAAAGAGKTMSLGAAAFGYGTMVFPTGEGMAGVNVLATRDVAGSSTAEGWVTASGLTGALFRRNGLPGFMAADASAWGSMGTTQASASGVFTVSYVPLPAGQGSVNIHLQTEPVNALYTGQYGVGPYGAGAVTPSGSTPAAQSGYGVASNSAALAAFAPSDAGGSCGNGLDGVAGQPVAVAASGWWQGLACGYGHVSYLHLPMRAGRTFTVEVTALDAGGLTTTAKMMPVMGLWAMTDSTTAQPTQGVSATAFQGRGVGMTTLAGSSGSGSGALTEMRLGIADQRGDGRPDYPFQARYFYADSVAPTQLPAAGGTVTVAGYGFKAGNAVYVNGVPGSATSWTANSITVTAPTMSAAGATAGTAVDVKVVDLSTGAVSTMTGAVTYTIGPALAKAMKLVSAEVADVVMGSVAPVAFAVQVVAADGKTPVAGDPVVFSVAAGTAGYGACNGGAFCTVLTDANGMAQTTVTPGAAGIVTMQAADGLLQQQASFNGLARNARMDVIQAPSGTQVVGVVAQPDFLIRVYGPDGSAPAVGRTITWTVTGGSAILSGCYAPVCATATAGNGVTSITVTPLLPGTVTVTATDGSLTQTISFQAVLSLDTMEVTSVPTSPAQVGQSAGVFGVHLITPSGYGDYFQPVVYTAPAGISFDQCGGNPCTVGTNSAGYTGAAVTALAPGTYTLTATFGSGISAVSQTTTVTAIVKSVTQLRIISTPDNNQPVGQWAAKPFSVQLLHPDGTPWAGTGVSLGGANDTVLLDCGRAACLMDTDGNGMASASVAPLHAGVIALSASAYPFSASTTFTAIAAGKLMTVVAQPANGTYVGDAATYTVQVLQPDGVTPVAGDAVTFSVNAGGFGFGTCGASTCTVTTNSAGRASVTGSATAAGVVGLTAVDGSGSSAVSQSVSFSTQGRVDLMQVVQAPSGKVTAGSPLAVPFAVRVLLPDGVTPAVGRTVLFAVSVGYAGFGACPAANCTVTTDANGLAQTTVSPLVPGAVTLEAVDTSAGQTAYVLASFTAVGAGDSLRVVSQPENNIAVYDFAQQPLTVQLVGPDGVTGVAGQSITIATTVGNTGTTLCNGAPGCVGISDAQGMVTTLVRPLSTGTVTMTATAESLSQSMTFTVLPRPDTMTLVSGPADGSPVGGPAAVPFSVRVLQSDGSAAAGRSVVLSVASGTATFAACGSASCAVVADASGLVSSMVTPGSTGAVSLVAMDGKAQVTYTFQAAVAADAIAVVSSPANGGVAGVAGAPVFAVRVTAGYPASAAAGRTVVFTVVSGSAALACGTASCSVVTDGQGMANVGVTPSAAGTVVLQAAEGGANVQVSFTVQGAHRLRLVSVPADGAFVGVVAAPVFAVQVVLADGVTVVVGEQVTVSATNGTVCGVASCVGVSDAQGMVQMGVTPAAPGSVRVQAVDGAAQVSASFNAVTKPDVLTLVSGPSGAGTVGSAMPAAFAVRLVAGDGSARVGVAVVFSVAAGGAGFGACSGAASCSVVTDASGMASSAVTPSAAGAVTVSAASEGMSVSASFTASDPAPPAPPVPPAPDVLTLVSGPSGAGTVGSAMPAAFAVRLVAGDGSARVGVAVVFSVAAGGAGFGACSGAAPCSVVTDASGMASTAVTPSAAGAVTVSAATEGMSVSASFTASDPAPPPPVPPAPDVLTLVSGPSGVGTVGSAMPAAFAVRLLAGDGSARVGVAVVFSVAAGGAGFGACFGAASCSVVTDASGMASSAVTPSAAGAVTVSAASEGMSVSASFTASAPAPPPPVPPAPDVLTLVSGPSGAGTVGSAMPAAFAVRLVAGDGSARVGVAVVFSVAAGGAGFGACSGAASCSVVTDASGMASSAVTPSAAGAVTVSAGTEGMSVSASFMALPAPDRITIAQAPAASVYVGDSTGFAVQIMLADGVTPAVGVSVTFSGGTGQVSFDACPAATCTVSTDAHGLATIGVTGVQPGGVLLVATADAASRAGAVSAPLQVLANVYGLAGTPVTRYVTEGVVFHDEFAAAATRNGVAASGISVGWTGSAGAAVAAPTVVTDAAGVARMQVALGPMGPGATGGVEACAWKEVCADFGVVGVSNASLTVTLVSGETQTLDAGAMPASMVAQVTDGAGHAVAGAAVTVFQTMFAAVSCPARGRCPAAAVLGTRASVLVSGADGSLSVTPMSGAGTGTATETKVQFTVGSSGVAAGDVESGG